MRFGTWNVRSLYRVGSAKTAARELERHKLNVVCVQEIKGDNGGTVRAGDYNFFYGKDAKTINCEQDICILQNSISC